MPTDQVVGWSTDWGPPDQHCTSAEGSLDVTPDVTGPGYTLLHDVTRFDIPMMYKLATWGESDLRLEAATFYHGFHVFLKSVAVPSLPQTDACRESVRATLRREAAILWLTQEGISLAPSVVNFVRIGFEFTVDICLPYSIWVKCCLAASENACVQIVFGNVLTGVHQAHQSHPDMNTNHAMLIRIASMPQGPSREKNGWKKKSKVSQALRLWDRALQNSEAKRRSES